jgi:hypothetical protein
MAPLLARLAGGNSTDPARDARDAPGSGSMSMMPTRAKPEDEAKLAAYATQLADAIEAALPGWVERCVARFVPVDGDVAVQVQAVGSQVRDEVGDAVRRLLATDLDDQRTNPLNIIRHGVDGPTRLLRSLGVAPIARDEFDERMFPEDVYGLAPASFVDVDPALHEPGLRWGAAKAYVFQQRRRIEGRR